MRDQQVLSVNQQLVAVMLAVALVMAGVGTAAPATAAQPQGEGVAAARVSGPNRFATAASIAALAFEDAEVAHLVFGGNYPDALAASYAAGVAGGPILLTAFDEVPQPTWAALEQLGVQRVVLVGGEGVISAGVQRALAAAGYATSRIAGATRYATAASIAVTYGDDGAVGTLDGDRTALIASGAGFADALAAGPVAARSRFPLLLTPPDTPNTAVAEALERLDIDRLVVVGGPAAVSPAIVTHYQALGYRVERWAGSTRDRTAVTVADNARERLGFAGAVPLLARGDDFPDALTASVLAARTATPILLAVSPTILGNASRSWLAARCPDLDAVRAVGGTAAVGISVLRDAVAAAAACRDPRLIGVPSVESRSEGFPGDNEVALLTDVRAAARGGFDRVVLEFEPGADQPGWSARWVEQPVEDGSGRPVRVAGNAYLEVTVSAASGVDLSGPEPRRTYTGPDRIRVDGGNVVEIVRTGDFEAVLTWVIGVERRAPFAIDFLEDPLRLVIDVLEAEERRAAEEIG